MHNELTGERKFYDAMLRVWGYIKNNLIDKENAEWFL
jgi:mannose/cellobiose epimerase-like protein (N-acyl-D-glucosamine 2-epimerase family)